MPFYRFYPTKDTFVSNGDGVLVISGSNMGASEILNLYKQVTGALGSVSGNHANILIAFDTSSMPATGSATASWFLHLADAQHAETLPWGYRVVVLPETQDWTEGQGQDLDYYTDYGVANWFSATNTSAWDAQGAWPTTTATLIGETASFATGHEDLDLDVTSIVTASYGVPFGFFIGLSGTFVTDGNEYYVKKFHSRHTHFATKKPYLELRWSSTKSTLATSTLYTVISGDYSGTTWASSSAWAPYIASGTMITQSVFSATVDPTGALVAAVPSLKPVYDTTEVSLLRLQCQLKDWNPATALTASSATPNVVLTKAYLRITDVITDEVLVPFSTGALVEYSRLSYDDSGSYFKIYMSSLPTGSLLQLDFIYEAPTGSGNWTLLPGTANRFRVISHG